MLVRTGQCKESYMYFFARNPGVNVFPSSTSSLPFRLQSQGFFFFAMMKHHDQKEILGENCLFSLHFHIEGSKDSNLNARADAEVTKGAAHWLAFT